MPGGWLFHAALNGGPNRLQSIELRGEIGGVQVRNILALELGRAVIIFTNRGDWNFGEIWQGKGFNFDLLSAALCSN